MGLFLERIFAFGERLAVISDNKKYNYRNFHEQIDVFFM